MSEQIQVVCPQCGARNKAPQERLGQGPVCGKCKAPLLTAKPAELSGEMFARQVAHSELPVLVDFWAPWCGPCRMMAPAFEQAAQRLHPKVRLVKLNTEADQATASRYGIQSIPTMVLFQGGRDVARVSGAMSADQIISWLQAKVRL